MPGDCQLVLADRRHARQIAGRECSAGLAGPQVVSVLPGDDQVFGVPIGVSVQCSRRAGLELATAGQVALEAAGQVRALGVPVRGQDDVGPGQALGHVGSGGLPGYLVGVGQGIGRTAAGKRVPVLPTGQAGRLPGSPKRGRTVLSNRVMAQIRFPVRVNTSRPTAWSGPPPGSRR